MNLNRLSTLPWTRVFPFLSWRHEVTRVTMRADLLAGVVGASAVLPQAVAFATIAGLPPQYGIYAAIVPAVAAALFGSSKHLVSGPTTAISIVVFAALSPLAEPTTERYVALAITLALLVGIFELAFGIMRFGAVLNFISHTVIVGFTAGAAILIAASQIKNFFGISIPQGDDFAHTIGFFLSHLGDVNPYVTGVALFTVVIGVAFKRFVPKVPYMLPAIVFGSLFGLLLNHLFGVGATHIRTIGALPSMLPPLSLPHFEPAVWEALLSSALAITLLALMEAAAIAQAIALRSGQRVDSNQEFIGQGVSNIFGSFFSSYPSSGSFNRTGLNFEAGAKTPLASVFAAAALGVIVMFVTPLAAYLPLAVMAGILFLVAWGLIDTHHIRGIFHASWREAGLLSVTFLSTLFLDLELAIFVGAFLSIALYLHGSSRVVVLPYLPNPRHPKRRFSSAHDIPRCPQLSIVRIEGALFFGSVRSVEDSLRRIEERHPSENNILIIMEGVPFIDLSGADMLLREKRLREKRGGNLFLSNISERVLRRMERMGHVRDFGDGHIFESKAEALSAIIPKLDMNVCAGCPNRIFGECPAGVREEISHT